LRHSRSLLFGLFILSGFCGLLYQVVWLRLAFASFGIVTPVLSVVVSVFMIGLAIGSWLGGNLAKKIAATAYSPLWLYGVVEAGIGVGAFVLPWSFSIGENALLSFGDMDSLAYLAASGLFVGAAILPWCILMGATFPAAMAYLQRQDPKEHTGFSFLYLGNVIGAMSGAILTAAVIVELLGFTGSLVFGASLNLLIALTSFLMAARDRSPAIEEPTAPLEAKNPVPQDRSALWILFLTGFASMAMEVVWTRAFTPALRTTIYAFALLLATYLFATWVGSYRYRKALATGVSPNRERLLLLLALTACLPIVLNDPRLYLRGVGALLSIFPFCALLGFLTPMLIDQYSNGEAKRAGFAYAINIVGCVIGPLFAGYLLLPTLGVKWSLVVLALPFFYWIRPKKALGWKPQAIAATGIALLVLSMGPARSYEEHMESFQGIVRRDHTATVISTGVGMTKQLYVNGMGITFLTPLTKLMAHVPLAMLSEPPQSALVICFGMGTTFRSLLSWDLDAWAAELVPSVRDAFGYYFSDGPLLLKSPKAHVVVDDGRRFLKRSREHFDVITLDPPPPIEAAGSSLLYSTEFYRDAKARLTPKGILQQWFPGGEDKVREAITASLLQSFRYVRAFKSLEFSGFHFLASDFPIADLTPAQMAAKLSGTAKQDLMEWYPNETPEGIFSQFLASEVPVQSIAGKADWMITDDRPLNEYYLLRRFFAKFGD
jgi:spermidine synthase